MKLKVLLLFLTGLPVPGRGYTRYADNGKMSLSPANGRQHLCPPSDSVTQTGSPENRSLYSGVRRKRTIRSLIINWSINSASSSVSLPSQNLFHQESRSTSGDMALHPDPLRLPGKPDTRTARLRGASLPDDVTSKP